MTRRRWPDERWGASHDRRDASLPRVRSHGGRRHANRNDPRRRAWDDRADHRTAALRGPRQRDADGVPLAHRVRHDRHVAGRVRTPGDLARYAPSVHPTRDLSRRDRDWCPGWDVRSSWNDRCGARHRHAGGAPRRHERFPARCGRGRWGFASSRRSNDRQRTIHGPDRDPIPLSQGVPRQRHGEGRAWKKALEDSTSNGPHRDGRIPTRRERSPTRPARERGLAAGRPKSRDCR